MRWSNSKTMNKSCILYCFYEELLKKERKAWNVKSWFFYQSFLNFPFLIWFIGFMFHLPLFTSFLFFFQLESVGIFWREINLPNVLRASNSRHFIYPDIRPIFCLVPISSECWTNRRTKVYKVKGNKVIAFFFFDHFYSAEKQPVFYLLLICQIFNPYFTVVEKWNLTVNTHFFIRNRFIKNSSRLMSLETKKLLVTGFLPIVWYKIPWFFPDISLISKKISLIKKNSNLLIL